MGLVIFEIFETAKGAEKAQRTPRAMALRPLRLLCERCG